MHKQKESIKRMVRKIRCILLSILLCFYIYQKTEAFVFNVSPSASSPLSNPLISNLFLFSGNPESAILPASSSTLYSVRTFASLSSNDKSCKSSNLFFTKRKAQNASKHEQYEEKTSVHLKNNKSTRKLPFVGANWKCNGSRESVQELVSLLNDIDNNLLHKIDVVVCPPSLHMNYVQQNLNKKFKVATQDVSIHNNYGPFTGELCSKMIKDHGIDWCVVGHSERRQGFGMNGETDEVVGRKVKSALAGNLNVIACIGEKLEDQENGRTLDVIKRQINEIVANIDEHEWHRIVIAYEPVWAIGTGKNATPQTAQYVHKAIREIIASKVSDKVANEVRILYGGSVKGSNSMSLISENDVDGFLVGGASLTDDFVKILQQISKTKKFEN